MVIIKDLGIFGVQIQIMRFLTSKPIIKLTCLKNKGSSEFGADLLKINVQGDDIVGLDVPTLEELQNFHVDAITKICQAKVVCLYGFFSNELCWFEFEF